MIKLSCSNFAATQWLPVDDIVNSHDHSTTSFQHLLISIIDKLRSHVKPAQRACVIDPTDTPLQASKTRGPHHSYRTPVTHFACGSQYASPTWQHLQCNTQADASCHFRGLSSGNLSYSEFPIGMPNHIHPLEQHVLVPERQYKYNDFI